MPMAGSVEQSVQRAPAEAENAVGNVIEGWSRAYQRYHPSDGIIGELDLVVYLLYLAIQNLLDVEGDIAELGVFRGGPFALLTTMLKGDERAHAIDVFDLYLQHPDPQRRFGNDPQQFRETVSRVAGPGARYQMISADSRDPAHGRATIEKVGPRCRFFHVDGDHRLVNIRADLRIAAACAGSQMPIIVVDDTFANTMPEVTQGLFEFLLANPDWQVFLTSRTKTYVCRAADHGFYATCALRFLDKGLHAGPQKIEVRHLNGVPCLALRSDAAPEVDGLDLALLRRMLAEKPSLPAFAEDSK
jgi:hypothetical protein